MGCCGDKRAQLSRDRSVASAPHEDAGATLPAAHGRGPRVFEYVGPGSLTVQGVISGRRYRFERAGDRLEVAYDDAFAMMAERDVRPA